MNPSPLDEEDGSVRAVYHRMRQEDASFDEAVAASNLSGTEELRVRRRLDELGLLDAGDQIAVDAATALARILDDTGNRLDDLTRLLSRRHGAATALANHYLPVDRNPGRVEIVRNDEHALSRMNQVLDELAHAAWGGLVSMHPPATWLKQSLDDALRRDRMHIERGAHIRCLYAQQALRHSIVRDALAEKQAMGVGVRIAPLVPFRFIVYDNTTAVIDAPDRDDIYGVVVRDRHIALALSTLFDFCWLAATDLAAENEVDTSELGEQKRIVLRLLANGSKDEAIARHLGVSTRTVTRIIAELTETLGATGRFQAGVRAAKLGLL